MATFITCFDTPAPGPARRLAVKDNIDMAGVPTTNGSRVIAASAPPAEADAACLAGARTAAAAGELTFAGKTNLHELAFGVTGINPWFGTPVNPLNPRLVPGGSSSGSAVAVASGECDMAFGSDTGGSIRIPAACCGVVGLKTTRHRVPVDGVLPLAVSLDTIGPMARRVDGVAAGLALLEPGFSRPARAAHRIGRVRLPAEAWIDQALDGALAASGLEMVEVQLPGWNEATAATMTIMAAEAWRVHHDLWRQHGGDLSPDVSARLETAASITGAAVAAAWKVAARWERELAEVFAGVEVAALPTLAASPPTLEDAARLTDIRYVAPFNLAGIPALAVPVAPPGGNGLPSGVPASLQLAGPAGSEGLLLATAAVVEEAAGFCP
jgi:amidase